MAATFCLADYKRLKEEDLRTSNLYYAYKIRRIRAFLVIMQSRAGVNSFEILNEDSSQGNNNNVMVTLLDSGITLEFIDFEREYSYYRDNMPRIRFKGTGGVMTLGTDTRYSYATLAAKFIKLYAAVIRKREADKINNSRKEAVTSLLKANSKIFTENDITFVVHSEEISFKSTYKNKELCSVSYCFESIAEGEKWNNINIEIHESLYHTKNIEQVAVYVAHANKINSLALERFRIIQAFVVSIKESMANICDTFKELEEKTK